MNRFRRKSESRSRRKGKDDGRASSVLSEAASSEAGAEGTASPSLGLPEFGDFRQSLIMPGLAKRFSLLRSEDGQLVDIETMQSHVAQQRQTGFMSASEADALLAQYRLQSQYESAQPKLPRPKRERLDWRSIEEEGSGEGSSASLHGDTASMRTSFATTNEDYTRSSLGATQQSSLLFPSTSATSAISSPAASVVSLAGSTSAASPPPLGASTMSRESSASGSSGTTYPYQYRRGANSLFGGRTLAAREIKMIKSGSNQSIASLAKSDKSRSAEGGEEEGAASPRVDGEEPSEEGSPQAVFDSPAQSPAGLPQIGVSVAGDAGDEGAEVAPSTGAAFEDGLAETGRSPSLHASEAEGFETDRVASAGDDDERDERAPAVVQLDTASPAEDGASADPTSPISPVTESDLNGLGTFNVPSPTLDYPVDGLPSPAVSDTEPVDPFYQRMTSPPLRAPPSPPVHELSCEAHSPVQPVTENTAAARSSIHSSPPASLHQSSPPLPSSSSIHSNLSRHALDCPTRDSPSPRPSIIIPARSARLRELSLETDDDAGETPSTAGVDSPSSPPMPAAYSFPIVPARNDSGTTEHVGERGGDGGAERLDVLAVDEADRTVSDRPPFDLSLGEGDVTLEEAQGEPEQAEADALDAVTAEGGMFEQDEGAGAQEDMLDFEAQEDTLEIKPAEVPLGAGAGERQSTITLESTGSSFHEALETPEGLDSEDDLLPDNRSIPVSLASSGPAGGYLSASSRPHSLGITLPDGSSPTPDAAHLLRPISVPLDRQASNELHSVLATAFRGDGADENADTSDLILQDLLIIQEKLVQSAARRAASQSLATPSSFATSDDGASLASPLEPISPLRIRKRVPSYTPPTEEQTSPARRKDSVESSSPISDLGGALAGLGLMSLTPSDLAPSSSQRQSRRASSTARRMSMGRRTSEQPRTSRMDEDGDERDSTLFGPASTHMTVQTSQTSSTSPFTNSVVTPSTTQSDAFEFSSLVGSPETGSWEDAQEHLREDSLAPGSVRTASSPQIGDSYSPVPSDHFDDAAHDTVTEPVDPAFDGVSATDSSPMLHLPSTSSATMSPVLGEAAGIDTQSFLRVPRNMPLRDPSTTTSMLIRDVRNQATLATIALKKQSPASPPTKPLNKSRSVRKLSISSPQLVSGPVNIPAVPINPAVQPPETSRFRVSRSKSRKKKDEGGKSEGLGLRFKMLLKKQHSRDQLSHLNGDEVTPFVDTAEAPERRPRISGIPITPPNQFVQQFESPSSMMTQSSDGSVPTPRQGRSPVYRPASGMRTLGEATEHSSTASGTSGSPHIASPTSSSRPSDVSSHSRTLSRGSPREPLATTRNRSSSSASHKSVRDRAPTPPPASRHRHQASVASSREAGPVPLVPAALSPPAPVAGPSTLTVPASPSLGSLASRKSSEYAGSFIDFYADGDEGDEADGPQSPYDEAALAQAYEGFDSPTMSHGRRPSLVPSVDEQLAQQHEQELTARLRPVNEFEEHPEYGNAYGAARGVSPAPTPGGEGDEVVWQVLDDLRNNRLSVVSKDSSFGFSSRDSSFALDEETSGGGDRTNAIAGMLRHRNRQRSSAGSSMPSEWDGRYPSIYFREEQALIQLGEQGGVAPEAEGRFLVRTKEVEPEVPPVPEEFRGQQVGWSRG
ncbi:hypothetical protein JCM10450v2_000161 [Rhodotorula kratochvilovae]